MGFDTCQRLGFVTHQYWRWTLFDSLHNHHRSQSPNLGSVSKPDLIDQVSLPSPPLYKMMGLARSEVTNLIFNPTGSGLSTWVIEPSYRRKWVLRPAVSVHIEDPELHSRVLFTAREYIDDVSAPTVFARNLWLFRVRFLSGDGDLGLLAGYSRVLFGLALVPRLKLHRVSPLFTGAVLIHRSVHQLDKICVLGNLNWLHYYSKL
ncbi:hypothetical protein RHGRI_004871 [Rhododendron griersonianum]|uniref:Uncharacterized protein n=1 Tax=Rhododendron griersonianum TaxID=479676 RepID=A0AAV6LB07_9ERIC|nr:hypothetical protein RHGRI_004871 [Rhododendron griersonianum]